MIINSTLELNNTGAFRLLIGKKSFLQGFQRVEVSLIYKE
jgi:hypothetical protein